MDLVALRKTLSVLLEIEMKTISKIEKYIALQDSSPLLQFQNDAESQKSEYSKLKSFSSKLVSDIELTDTYIAKLSSFICQADAEMDNDATLLLTIVFNGYVAWKLSVKAFIVNTDNIFNTKAQVKYSSILSEARSLYTATQTLCRIINDGLSKITVL